MKNSLKINLQVIVINLILTIFLMVPFVNAQTYSIVDSDQTETFDNDSPIITPTFGESFFGQDGQHSGNQPSYIDNGDGTISDEVTGLMWVQARGEKMSWAEAYDGAADFDLAGYEDWRMPTIKELYSLIMFSGNGGTSAETSTPFINTDYFDFVYGNTDIGERWIDSQDWSATHYVGLTMMGDSTAFGVNFADGRIKGYGLYHPQSGDAKELFVRYVRGNTEYGINDFTDNGDGTINDNATGLMWQQSDNESSMNWQEALGAADEANGNSDFGYDDWRLPNAKELQSLVDYSRAPDVTNSAAIDPLFEVPELGDNEYPFYWTSTTHLDGPQDMQYNGAVYLSFGRAGGWMESPPNSGNLVLMDVHGAGAQRSDPKAGDPDDYPYGHGPQGDVIRIYNAVRLVREIDVVSSPERSDNDSENPDSYVLGQNYPNPFNSSTQISFAVPTNGEIRVALYNTLGQEVDVLLKGPVNAGYHVLNWDGLGHQGNALPAGIYFYQLIGKDIALTQKMVYLK